MAKNLIAFFFLFLFFFFFQVLPLLLVERNLRNGIKPSFKPNLRPFDPNLVPNFFRGFYLYWKLDILASYHCMQFQGKIINQTWENGKKPSFMTDFCPYGSNSGSQIFFKNLASSVTRYHGQLCQKEPDDPILRKRSDGLTGGQTDESRKLVTNIERPIRLNKIVC